MPQTDFLSATNDIRARKTMLVSACLLGVACRYAGDGCFDARVAALRERHTLIPVCPEQLGGLPTPRRPAEIAGMCVVDEDGNDVTEEFQKGADETLKLARLMGCDTAVLKARSPSCGHGKIYDGTFGGKTTAGSGVTASLLARQGIRVLTEEELHLL